MSIIWLENYLFLKGEIFYEMSALYNMISDGVINCPECGQTILSDRLTDWATDIIASNLDV